MPEMANYPGAPRWVKVFGGILVVLILMVVLVRLTGAGGHGPGRHIPFGEPAGQTAPSDATEEHLAPDRGHTMPEGGH